MRWGKRILWHIAFLLMVLGGGIAILYSVYRYALNRGQPWAVAVAERPLFQALSGQHTVVASVHTELSINPHLLYGVAKLKVVSEVTGRSAFAFLLNPGLHIESATISGQKAAVLRTWYGISIKSNLVFEPGQEAEIEITYRGEMRALPFAEPVWENNEILLRDTTFWYPADRQRFFTFYGEVVLPNGFVLANSMAKPATSSAGTDREQAITVPWEEPAPVMGVSLAAGKYRQVSRTHGTLKSDLFVQVDEANSYEPELIAAGAAYNYYQSQLGTPAHTSLDMVISARLSQSFFGGNGMIALKAQDLLANAAPDPYCRAERFMQTARLVAECWWGGTVGVRLWTNDGEGGAWLTKGLAEYWARQAMSSSVSKVDTLSWRERQMEATSVTTSLSNLSVHQCDINSEQLHFVRLRGSCVAGLLESKVGHDDFCEASQRFIRENRYGTPSCTTFCHVLSVVSHETALDDYYDAFFVRMTQWNLSILTVEQKNDRVRVQVACEGLGGLSVPVVVGVETESGVVSRTVDVRRDAQVELQVTAPVTRAVVDPLFTFQDATRGDNIWPRQVWPCAISGAIDSPALAVTTRSEWLAISWDAVTLIDPAQTSVVRMKAPKPSVGDLISLGAGRWATKANGDAESIWCFNSAKLPGDDKKPVEFPEPLLVNDSIAQRIREAGANMRDVITSRDGTHSAWKDATGGLWMMGVNDTAQHRLDLKGEVIAFDWSGNDHLVCVVVQRQEEWPMLCYAQYSLWRVRVGDGVIEKMDYDIMHP